MTRKTRWPVLPDRPRLTVRVGVTGHRTGGLPRADSQRLRERIRLLLGVIRDEARTIHAASAGEYSTAEPALRVVSSLASGSDCLVADEALPMGYALHVPLPFDRGEFRADFETAPLRENFDRLLAEATAVLELDGTREDAVQAYVRASGVMLEQSDLLLAIWDGEPSPLLGGTAHTVTQARAIEMPVLVIDAADPHRVRIIAATAPSSEVHELRGAVREALAVQFPPTVDSTDPVRKTYFTEAQPGPSGSGVFRRFRAFLEIGGSVTPHPQTSTGSEPDTLASVPAALRAEHQRADDLAQHYAARYRDAFVGNYLIGATAVLMALIGFVSPVGTVFEFALIAMILVVTDRGRRGQWHERWLGYRLCAEQLRHLALLRPLGRALPSFRVPAHASASDPSRSWSAWLARARTREIGLAQGSLTASSLQMYRRKLEDEVRGQVAYHKMASQRSHLLAHRLHALGTSLFYLTLLVCVGHLALEAWHHTHPGVTSGAGGTQSALSMNGALTLLAAVLPAFGAAFAGIASQGEFDRIAQRSRAMSQQLDALLPRLTGTSQTSDVYAEVAVQGVEIMTAELLDWQTTFRAKPITLPA